MIKIMFSLLFMIAFTAAAFSLHGCWWEFHDDSCCEHHSGYSYCDKDLGATHGHIICRDGYRCSDECN